MKKILFLASESINLKSGGGLANRAFHDSLMLHYPGQVDVVQLQHSSNDIDRPHYFYVPEVSKWSQMNYALHGHFHRLYKWLPLFLEQHGHEYSHCIMNQTYYGDMISTIMDYGIKVAVIHHNYEVIFQRDNKLPATLYGLTTHFVKRNERAAVSQAALNMYLTESDFKTFNSVYPESAYGKHTVIGIYETAIATTPNLPNCQLEPNVLAVCGSLNNKQTILGIHDLMENYFSSLREVMGEDFRLIITGRNPSEYIQKLPHTHTNISLVPNPEHIEDILTPAGIFLCPINCGSGLKLRVMDGLRLGIPVLCHRISASGYEPFFSKKWFQIYDDASSFRSGLHLLSELLQKPQSLREEIACEYRQHFSFESGDKRFISAIEPFLQTN